LVNIVVSLSSAAVLTGLREPELPKQAEKPKLSSFPAAFVMHLKTSFSFMLGHLAIAARMFLDCSLATMYTLLVFFMQQHIVSSGLPARFVGIPLVMIGIGHFAGNRTAHAYAGKIGYGRLALLSLLIGGAGALLASSRLIPLSVIGSVIMGFFATLLEIATSARINAEIPSAQRATLISVSSMMYSVIMVGASPLIGFLCDSISTSAAFVIQGIYLVFIAAAGFTALAIRRLNKRKSLTADDTAR
jgi:MFS family permease